MNKNYYPLKTVLHYCTQSTFKALFYHKQTTGKKGIRRVPLPKLEQYSLLIFSPFIGFNSPLHL